MTASDCIRGKGKAGVVDDKWAEETATLFDDQLADLRHRNAPRPEDLAGQRSLSAAERKVRQRRRAALQQMAAQDEIRQRIRAHPDDPVEAALSLLDFDPRSKVAGANVHMMGNVIRGQVHARMVDFLEGFRSRMAGLDQLAPGVRAKRKMSLRAMVRELFGEASGDAEAKSMARAVSEGLEFQRQLANASGMSIGKLENWGLPQTHSARAINSVHEDEWIDFVMARLDREKMVNHETGQPFTDTRLRQLLSETYKDIVTNGLRDVQPGGHVGRNIAVKRSQQRFLIFRGADNWLEYHERFGDGDPFNAILSHVNGLSRDIAMLRVLGPNPDASIRYVERLVGERRGEQALAKTGRAGARAAGRLSRAQPRIRDLYAAVSGHLNVAANETFANAAAANRNVLTSAMLGGAWFSAIADRTFSDITARLNGIPAMKVMQRHLKMFAPGSRDDHRLAVQAGFVAEHWAGVAIAEQRFLGEVIGPEWSQRLADSVLRASFLSPWTTAGRSAFQLEFLGELTRQARNNWDGLNPVFRSAMERHGLSAGDWDVIRRTRAWRDEKTGAEFIRVQDIIGQIEEAGPLFDRNFEIANRLQSMILTETEFAVPSVTQRARAILTFGAQPGSMVGEIARNTMLFKSFPVTLIMTHLNRAVFGNITTGQKAKYLAHLIIGTAVMGTLGEQMSQISKGRDPLPMSPLSEEGRRTLFKGLTRGGGLGIFGDFIFADQNRFGGGIASTLLGPVFGSEIPRLTTLTVGNLQELIIEGRPQRMGREAVQFAEMMTPGRSLWYATLAMERLIFDEVQKMVDPDWAASFRAQEQRARREFGQSFYAPPGRGLPERGPNLERALR